MKKYDDYPDLLLVEHLIEILTACQNTVYKLLRSNPAFPVHKIGGKYLVPKKPFWEALMTGKLNNSRKKSA